MQKQKLLIANRGEIARRIGKTAHTMGYTIGRLYVENDHPFESPSPFEQERDHTHLIKVPSYLDSAAIVKAALSWGAAAVHPGYGFLSENSDFCAQITQAGMAFIGPKAETMALLGNKESAKNTAAQCGLPVLPYVVHTVHKADTWTEHDSAQLLKRLEDAGIQAPFFIRPTHGGGGRGARLVSLATVHQLHQACQQAWWETSAVATQNTQTFSFLCEPFLTHAWHVEVQAVGDGKGHVVTLGVRDCSVQRRYQKVIEECPSPHISPALAEQLQKDARRLLSHACYLNAGTVEFLVFSEDQYYFLEVNCRLQVEHPVTEMVWAVDLVQAQLEISQNLWPSYLDTCKPSGVAIEARILCENEHLLPQDGGQISTYQEPQGPHVRIDSGIGLHSVVNTQFDPMMAKLIVSAKNRSLAILTLCQRLEEFKIQGCTHNIKLLQTIVSSEDFKNARHHTSWLEHFVQNLKTPENCEDLCKNLHPLVHMFFRFPENSQGTPYKPPKIPQKPTPQTSADTHHLKANRQSSTPLGIADIFVANDTHISAPLTGRVVHICVAEGHKVRTGDVICILESMKMHMEVKSPGSGFIKSLLVCVGQIVQVNETIAWVHQNDGL